MHSSQISNEQDDVAVQSSLIVEVNLGKQSELLRSKLLNTVQKDLWLLQHCAFAFSTSVDLLRSNLNAEALDTAI